MVIYPQLIKLYEDKLMAFEIDDSVMSKILSEIVEIGQEETETLDSNILLEKLKLNFKTEMENLWELNMYKLQKTSLPDLKNEIDESLKEIQLKQINNDIKECMTLIKNNPSGSEETYARYQKLLEEKNKFLPNDE